VILITHPQNYLLQVIVKTIYLPNRNNNNPILKKIKKLNTIKNTPRCFTLKYKVKMETNYLSDIKEIKSLMESRSRFLSLSGLSGVLSGVYALIGAFIANQLASNASSVAYHDVRAGIYSPIVIKLVLVAAVVFISALATAYYFTYKKAKGQQQKIWTKATYRILVSFCVPFAAGAIVTLVLFSKGQFYNIAAFTLIFYGLALYSAGVYTYKDVQWLGISEVITGLLALMYTGYGLYFWAFGFGILHIVYGTIMYFKYDLQNK